MRFTARTWVAFIQVQKHAPPPQKKNKKQKKQPIKTRMEKSKLKVVPLVERTLVMLKKAKIILDINKKVLFKEFITSIIDDKKTRRTKRGCPRGVMVKAMDCGNRRTRVRTSVALLRSFSGKYAWERYEVLYPPSYGLNNATTVLLGEWLWHWIT